MIVHFLDVGQGDCSLIICDGKTMLIDAGENGNESDIIEYLNNQGVKTLTYFIATHPHSDHIGGAQEVINSFEVENIINSYNCLLLDNYKNQNIYVNV